MPGVKALQLNEVPGSSSVTSQTSDRHSRVALSAPGYRRLNDLPSSQEASSIDAVHSGQRSTSEMTCQTPSRSCVDRDGRFEVHAASSLC